MSFIEIGVNLDLRQIFGHETNAWVWERQIFDRDLLKTSDICF